MKNVLMVITKANWGGAQKYVFDLASGLPTAEFDVSVAFGQPGKLSEELQKAGIPTHPIQALQRDVSFSADIKSLFELRHLFKKERPDIVHLNSSKAGAVGALAARMAGVPRIIFTSHGLVWEENRNPISKLFIYLLSRFTFALCHVVITISKQNQQHVPRSVLIYNGIGTITFGSGDIIRKAFPTGAKIVGTVGELTHNKNQIALIEQAKKDAGMFVAIVGEGELRSFLEQKIKEYGLEQRVKLFGFIPANEVMRGFDVFALPSHKEGLPYVLLEARQAGLPIVASQVGGIPEILDDSNAQEFSLEKMVDKTVEVYRN